MSSFCSGCGRPVDEGNHDVCLRRQRATDPPRFCALCGRKLVVQVLPLGWRAGCLKCGVKLEGAPASAKR